MFVRMSSFLPLDECARLKLCVCWSVCGVDVKKIVP
jgi:hypothetical protein